MLYFRHVNRLALVGMVILTWLVPPLALSQTPLGTAFSYNGRLRQLGQPADGEFDFQIGLFNHPTDTNAQVGSIVMVEDAQVTEGLVVLELDFGVAFDRNTRWLELAVRPGAETGDFTSLMPRQRIDAVPQSQFSLTTAGFDFPIDETVNMDGAPFQITNDNTGGIAISGVASASPGNTIGVLGLTKSNNGGFGVRGFADTTSGESIGVHGVSLSPEGVGVLGANSATSGDAVGIQGSTSSPSGTAISGTAHAMTGVNFGMVGETNSPDGVGVKGENSIASPTGSSIGVLGESMDGVGVQGLGGVFGIEGLTTDPTGTAIFGFGGATGVNGVGDATGVVGNANNMDGIGVQGTAHAMTGVNFGMVGETNSPDGVGVKGENSIASPTGSSIGVLGESMDGVGVRGLGGVFGVEGQTTDPAGTAIFGFGGATGVNGVGDATGVGGFAASPDGAGVYGQNDATSGQAVGVKGLSTAPLGGGVFGENTSATGFTVGTVGRVDSVDGSGVFGRATSLTGVTTGVRGRVDSPEGLAVFGNSRATSGTNATGVWGETTSPAGAGVVGLGVDATGVNFGVWGETKSPNGFAGQFIGNVNITGTLTKGVDMFKIDHPLDPANKYLFHSVVESSDMKNVYDGVATLDLNGKATIELPDWFEALNEEFRYQLTPIGGQAPGLYIAQEVADNRFGVAGGTAGLRVSWQVTGIRHDLYAESNPLVVEQAKPDVEVGTFIYPELHGQPKTASLAFKRRGGSTASGARRSRVKASAFDGPAESGAAPAALQAFTVPDRRKFRR